MRESCTSGSERGKPRKGLTYLPMPPPKKETGTVFYFVPLRRSRRKMGYLNWNVDLDGLDGKFSRVLTDADIDIFSDRDMANTNTLGL